MKKRLSRYDRVQALIRNPNYLKDLEESTWKTTHGGKKVKYFNREKLAEFLKKYGIVIVLDPGEWKNSSPEKINGTAVFEDDWIVRVVHSGKSIMIPATKKEEKEKWAKTIYPDEPIEDFIFAQSKIELDLAQGKILTLQFDLSAPKEALLKKTEEYIDLYDEYVERSKERITPERQTDKFKIWDEYLKTKNFVIVAENLGLKTSSVRKAYLRAFEMIMGEKYRPQKHNRKMITKEQLAKTCDRCPTRLTCTVPCPDVLSYIDQDKASRKELPLRMDEKGQPLEPITGREGRKRITKKHIN